MQLLLIEDDPEISVMLRSFLETESFTVTTAMDGYEACHLFSQKEFQLVLLDLMLPKCSGLEVLQFIRRTSMVPIIIVSAKDSDSDITMGLALGADDYVTKPFSITEVLARIKANIRRTTQYLPAAPTEDVFQAGNLTMNLTNHTITKQGVPLTLTAKEFSILALFLQNPQKVYTKAQIYSLIWNDAYVGDENAVNVHMSRLRSKIEDSPQHPRYIQTVWGIGYKLGDNL